jgi:hypothetical protein
VYCRSEEKTSSTSRTGRFLLNLVAWTHTFQTCIGHVPEDSNFNFQSYDKLKFMLLLIYVYQLNQLYQFHRFQCASVACLQLFAVLSWFFRVTCLNSRVRRNLRCQQMSGSCLLFSDILRKKYFHLTLLFPTFQFNIS